MRLGVPPPRISGVAWTPCVLLPSVCCPSPLGGAKASVPAYPPSRPARTYHEPSIPVRVGIRVPAPSPLLAISGAI